MDQLIRCVNCDQVFHRTSFDQLPEYLPSPASPDSFRAVETDDYRDFLESHRGHLLEDLRIIDDSFVSEKPYVEPVKVSYFKATNGKERFVIKKFRNRVDEPLTYHLIYGDFALKCVKIEAQTEEIKKQLRSELGHRGLSREQMDAFARLCQSLTAKVDIKKLARVAEDSPHPLEIYFRMDDVSYAFLLRNCRKIFSGEEFQAIEAFADRHRDDGVLQLKATFEIHLTPTTRSKKKPYSAQESVDRKIVVKKG
jgi:hypothetical protein